MTQDLRSQAKNVAAAGRYGDTEILHVNKAELAGIASMLPLTQNPETGYYEAFLPFIAPLAAGPLAGAIGVSPALAGAGLGLAGGIAQGAMEGDIGSGIKQGLMGAAMGGLAGGIGLLGEGGANAAQAASKAGAQGASMAPMASPMPAPKGIPGGIGNLPPGAGAPGGPMAAPMAATRPPAGPMAGAAPGAGLPQKGIGGLLSGNKGAMLAAGAPAALSLMDSMGGKGPPDKRKSGPAKHYRGQREQTGAAPNREGRENRHFTQMRFTPYARGGLVGYAGGGMVGGSPWGAPMQSNRSVAAPAFQNTPLNQAPWQQSPATPPGGIASMAPPQMSQPPMGMPDAASYGLNMAQEASSGMFPGFSDVTAGQSPMTPNRPTMPTLPDQASAVGGTPAGPRFGFKEGGMVEKYQEGGITALDQPTQQASGDESIITEAVMAIRGDHPTPQAAIRRFIQRFGPEAFEELMRTQSGENDGMSDSVPTMNPDGRPAALSEGEYVMPSDVVSGLGNGDTRSGGDFLDEMVANVRGARTGNAAPPGEIEPEEMIPA